jgi:hypothetical protein
MAGTWFPTSFPRCSSITSSTRKPRPWPGLSRAGITYGFKLAAVLRHHKRGSPRSPASSSNGRLDHVFHGFTQSYSLLKAYLPVREPRKLNGRACYRVLVRQIDESFIPLIREVTLDFQVSTEAVDYLEIDIIPGGTARNEIFRCLPIAQSSLNPFLAAQVIGNPSLSSLVLAAIPVAEKLPFVCIAPTLRFCPLLSG